MRGESLDDLEGVFGAEVDATERLDKLDAWSNAMLARGYTRGPMFSSYDELSSWDLSNKRVHIRRRVGHVHVVYFTDNKTYNKPKAAENSSSIKSALDIDDEIPF